MTKSVLEKNKPVENTCKDKDVLKALYQAGSVSSLARALGIHRRTVHRWVREGSKPSPLAKKKVKAFLDE